MRSEHCLRQFRAKELKTAPGQVCNKLQLQHPSFEHQKSKIQNFLSTNIIPQKQKILYHGNVSCSNYLKFWMSTSACMLKTCTDEMKSIFRCP